MSENRFARQELWFGPDGQKRIATKKVGIVGVGGLGSHVAQQLAYSGVKNFSLIDPDKVSRSNLNRLIGANENDIETEKVYVSERMMKQVQKDVIVNTVPKDLRSKGAFQSLESCDFVFGCVDHDGPRFVLLEFCMAYNLPYLDLATDIPNAANDKNFGGRIVFSVATDSCLHCWDELSQDEIRDYLSTEYQREIYRKIYGEGGSGQSPSVVSLNGLIASVAVTEFLVEVTGIRRARPFLKYQGPWGIVTAPAIKEKPIERCYYCFDLKGKGRKAEVERYII
jgi:molybdopterin/thiamine biosynthesis adenylyltransferase